MFITYIALLFRIISNPIANVFQKQLVKTNSSISVNLYAYLFLSLVCSFYTGFHIDLYKNLPSLFWLYSILAGGLCTLGSVCLIKALKYGELSILGPINSYKCIVGLVISFFLLGEVPTLKGLLGLILIIVGSFFIFDKNVKNNVVQRNAVFLRLAALVFTGIEAAILKKIILISSPVICFTMWCYMGMVFSFLFLVLSHKALKLSKTIDYQKCLCVALFLGIMQYSTNLVFKYLDVGLSLALFQLSGIVTVILGWKMFSEQNILNKIVGSIVMLIGSSLILL